MTIAPAPPPAQGVSAPPLDAAAPPPPDVTPPPPPAGPGVYVPFPAPPTEGRGRRIGLALGISGAVLVLVCGGGVAAAVGLITVTSSALNEQARVVVGHFFDAVEAKRYRDAYNAQCQNVKDRETEAEFANRLSGSDQIIRHKIGKVDVASVDLSVPVEVTYADGASSDLHVYLGQDHNTGAFQVCGIEE